MDKLIQKLDERLDYLENEVIELKKSNIELLRKTHELEL